ncbi:G1/S-specific cyclin-D1 [Microcaecilia unicolor]|uniref:G1/S-specific cyclin-D1-like n=1 Tax=Microcaecilia unicolor TaxID=1415580 RepID=A0A6P7X6Q9_9AMPH|nr:G1/S-specific cyclin-D1-like [Microcaecilia unicolor]
MDEDRQLLCWEAGLELRARRDPVLLQSRVLQELLDTEERYRPSASYFQQVQEEVRPHMRGLLVRWMMEVCEEHGCEPEVFPLAVSCLDRFLSLRSMEKKRLQVLGSACLLLASKLKETTPLSTETLCLSSDFLFSAPELWSLELLVLNTLSWDIGAVTPLVFVQHFLELLYIPQERRPVVCKHTETFIVLSAHDCSFLVFPPSVIAAASICAAMTGLRLGVPSASADMTITALLAHTIQCDVDAVTDCQERLERALVTCLREGQRYQARVDKAQDRQQRAGTPTDVLHVHL